MSLRYKVQEWIYQEDSVMRKVRKGTTSRITIDDTHNDNQIVVTFHVQQCKRINYNPDYYGVNYNDGRLASKMAQMLCNQMNRESGYLVLKLKEKKHA